MTGLSLALAAAAATPQCPAAIDIAVPDVRIVAATPVDAGSGFRPPDRRASAVDIGFCRIEGVIEKEIGFELWLPLSGEWNGKLLTGGVGGQAGSYNYREMARGIARGYATASTDTGHKAADTHWLLGDPMRAANYAGRSNHLLAVKAKVIIAAYYGRPVSRAIFSGCSGGGRQALTAAQRYPDDYDGIIAGAPGANTPEMSARRMWEMVQHSRYAGLMARKDWALVARKGIEACDARDGVADGIVENPFACSFRIASLQCKPGQKDDCLSGDQVALAEKIHAPLHDENGKRIDDGLLPGVPVSATPLPEPFTPGPTYLAVALFGDGVHRDPNWDARNFVIARDLPAIDKVMNLHADDPDLSRFHRRGGKLIMYQGLIDPLVAPQSTVNYYKAIEAKMGRATARKLVRLFNAPGVDHCTGGAGADLFGGLGADGLKHTPRYDLLAALEHWLDTGQAPETVIAAKRQDGQVAFTRRLCAFPNVARWDGKGAPSTHASYSCAPPREEGR